MSSKKNRQREDQSTFISDQPVTQAPPDIIEKEKYRRAHKKELRKKRLKIIFGFLLLVVFISAIVVLILIQPKKTPPPPPEPTPSPKPIDPSALEAELDRITEQVELADPLKKPLIPPPVDMEVEF